MTTRLHLAWLGAALLATGCAQGSTQTAATPPLATQPTTGDEIGAVARNNVTVTFARNSASLSGESIKSLDVAARLFRDVNPVRMFAVGYADPSGSEYSNLLISAKRALVVKDALVARGIPPDRVQIQAFGASELADQEAPASPSNRRVVVTWRVI